jgi:hypothetical protein
MLSPMTIAAAPVLPAPDTKRSGPMARIIPTDLTQLALSGAHEPEIDTLAVLRDALPDACTIFHGVHWTRQYKGHTLYGEIDFVIMNAAGQLLCIEQKNGGLEEGADGLFKHYGAERKDVGAQVYSKGQVSFDTARRFKGQQAAAVILTDVDPREADLARQLQVLFCGLTRATVRLDLVCNADNPVVAERLLPLS